MLALVAVVVVIVLLVSYSFDRLNRQTASRWHAEGWMQIASEEITGTYVAIGSFDETDDTFVSQEIEFAKRLGCTALELTVAWPKIHPVKTLFDLQRIKQRVEEFPQAPQLLCIPVVNADSVSIPDFLDKCLLGDAKLLTAFERLIEAISPLLGSRIRYLSLGFEVDLFLNENPDRMTELQCFFDEARRMIRAVSTDVIVGVTLSEEGIVEPRYRAIDQSMDAYFTTYCNLQRQRENRDLDFCWYSELARELSDKSLVIHRATFPSGTDSASLNAQSEFVSAFFDAIASQENQVEFASYCCLFDPFADEEELGETSRAGLIAADGNAKPALQVFKQRMQQLSDDHRFITPKLT